MSSSFLFFVFFIVDYEMDESDNVAQQATPKVTNMPNVRYQIDRPFHVCWSRQRKQSLAARRHLTRKRLLHLHLRSNHHGPHLRNHHLQNQHRLRYRQERYC